MATDNNKYDLAICDKHGRDVYSRRCLLDWELECKLSKHFDKTQHTYTLSLSNYDSIVTANPDDSLEDTIRRLHIKVHGPPSRKALLKAVLDMSKEDLEHMYNNQDCTRLLEIWTRR